MVMIAMCARALQGSELPGFGGVALSFVYWTALAIRYAVRMARRPEQRWFGGTVRGSTSTAFWPRFSSC